MENESHDVKGRKEKQRNGRNGNKERTRERMLKKDKNVERKSEGGGKELKDVAQESGNARKGRKVKCEGGRKKIS